MYQPINNSSEQLRISKLSSWILLFILCLIGFMLECNHTHRQLFGHNHSASLHFSAFVYLGPVTQLLVSQVYSRWKYYSSRVFSPSGTCFETVCLLAFSRRVGSEKPIYPLWKPIRAVMYGNTTVFPTGTWSTFYTIRANIWTLIFKIRSTTWSHNLHTHTELKVQCINNLQYCIWSTEDLIQPNTNKTYKKPNTNEHMRK